MEGGLDEDDYGRIVPPEGFTWNIIPNHENGSFYGYQSWSENFYDLMKHHPVYVDPHDAFCGKWMFFLSRMKGPVWNPDDDYSDLKPELEKYNIISGIGSDAHFAPDYTIGLSLGWEGLRKKLREYREKNGEECREFYEAEEKTIDAIQLWMGHTIERIEEMIPLEADPALKKNLMEMAEVNKRILTEAPRTMREACQWLCWFNMASRTYNRDGAGGQLDELLRPYYERDLKAGLIDDEDAVYYIACLLLNDTHYYQLGGPDGDGRDVTSHISYLILEAADRIDTSCNLTLRVHEGLPEDFFLKAVGYLFRNQNGWPRFSGDKALVEGFVKNGYPPELARKRIAVGCNWMSLPGLEYTLNDLVKINTARVFEVAFDEMMGLPEGEWSVERLWELFTAHLVKAVGATPNGRKAGTPINHGANPMPGFRKDGAVTAMANTIAAIQPGYGNTAPIQLELDPGLVQDEEPVKKIADLIRTIFEKGATLLNINIIDEKKILAAHKDPSLYPDLVVRVTGFTAYFSMLSQEFRQLVVDRIIAKE